MKIYATWILGGYFPNPEKPHFQGSYRIQFTLLDRIFRRSWVEADPFFSVIGKADQLTCENAIEQYISNRIQSKQPSPDRIRINVLSDGTFTAEEIFLEEDDRL